MDWTQVLVVVVTAGAALGTWGLNEQSKRRFEDYTRREARYVELVRSIRGFHAGVDDIDAKERFLTELELCWLYGSDDVVRAAYRFLDTMKTGRGSSEAQRLQAVGDLVLGIRKDLLRRAPFKETDLKSSEFEILSANRS